MEAERFDRAIRALTLPTSRRRGVLALLGALLATALPDLDGEAKQRLKHAHRNGKKRRQVQDEGKKKKKGNKKKKKPPVQPVPVVRPLPVCAQLREICQGNCCGSLVCEDVLGCDAPSGPYCCGAPGAACQSVCDCCGTLLCSERHGNTCRNCGIPQDACGTDEDCCAAVSSCGANGCSDGTVCVLNVGAACARSCDCSVDLFCSERANKTCQHCALPQESCSADTDCCLAMSTCGRNGCVAEPNRICCQGAGAFCIDSCDCCADLICDEDREACVPLDPLRGATVSKHASSKSQASDFLSPTARWPRT
jgi:hypothetical protein